MNIKELQLHLARHLTSTSITKNISIYRARFKKLIKTITPITSIILKEVL